MIKTNAKEAKKLYGILSHTFRRKKTKTKEIGSPHHPDPINV